MVPGQKAHGQERVCLDHRGKVCGTRMGSAPRKIRWGPQWGKSTGEAETAHSSTGRHSVAEGGSPRTRGHAPPKEEEMQRRKGRAGPCQRSKVGVRGSQQLPSRSPGWALMPHCLAVCAFPYLLAFTTDSMEIRLVVNGNLVHTAVVPQLQLVASRVSTAGVYFCLRGFGHPQTMRSQAGKDTFVARLMMTSPHVW